MSVGGFWAPLLGCSAAVTVSLCAPSGQTWENVTATDREHRDMDTAWYVSKLCHENSLVRGQTMTWAELGTWASPDSHRLIQGHTGTQLGTQTGRDTETIYVLRL